MRTESTCAACSQGKLIIQSSPMKVSIESTNFFLKKIQGDICGPINPSSGRFLYFLILIDESTRWSHVSLLSSRGVAFARFRAQIIRLKAQFPNFSIKKIILDNVSEFTSKSFNDYCMLIGLDVKHSIAHTHAQNGLAESLIKRLQLIARPLILKSKICLFYVGNIQYYMLHH